jgi:hypothetical protein
MHGSHYLIPSMMTRMPYLSHMASRKLLIDVSIFYVDEKQMPLLVLVCHMLRRHLYKARFLPSRIQVPNDDPSRISVRLWGQSKRMRLSSCTYSALPKREKLAQTYGSDLPVTSDLGRSIALWMTTTMTPMLYVPLTSS